MTTSNSLPHIWNLLFGNDHNTFEYLIICQNVCLQNRFLCLFSSVSCSVTSDSLQLHELKPVRLLCPWVFPGKNAGVGCHFQLQGIFPTQELNPGLPHCLQAYSLPYELPGMSLSIYIYVCVYIHIYMSYTHKYTQIYHIYIFWTKTNIFLYLYTKPPFLNVFPKMLLFSKGRVYSKLKTLCFSVSVLLVTIVRAGKKKKKMCLGFS